MLAGENGARPAIAPSSRLILGDHRNQFAEKQKGQSMPRPSRGFYQESSALLWSREPLVLATVVDVARGALKRFLGGLENEIAFAVLLHDFQ